MSSNLEQFKLIEKIKISYLINRGNVVAISEELQLPLEYIKKLVGKFRKQESKDISVLISNNIMEYIFMGYKARTHNLTEMWKALLGKDKSIISICCEAPVKKLDNPDPQGRVYGCLACHGNCFIDTVTEEGIVELKMGILEQLREEDAALVEFADKMGYTNKVAPESPLVGTLQQNVLVIGEGMDKKVVEDYSKLSPIDRQKIIDTIDAKILEEKKDTSDES